MLDARLEELGGRRIAGQRVFIQVGLEMLHDQVLPDSLATTSAPKIGQHNFGGLPAACQGRWYAFNSWVASSVIQAPAVLTSTGPGLRPCWPLACSPHRRAQGGLAGYRGLAGHSAEAGAHPEPADSGSRGGGRTLCVRRSLLQNSKQPGGNPVCT